MDCTWGREDNIRREMEAAWQPPTPKTVLPSYDPESDPFCPLGTARRFNQLQREYTSNGSPSLIENRFNDGRKTSAVRRSPRPRSSQGRMTTPASDTPAQAPPFLVGAMLQVQEGGGFTSVRQPPLRGKGLPSRVQLNEGHAKSAKERKFRSKSEAVVSAAAASREHQQQKQSRDPAELDRDSKEDFAARVAKRDEFLQDLWLKMHSGEGLVQVRDDLSRLLIRYRAASLEVLEDMMRHPQLEPIADALLRRKGEGFRVFRASVAQDADFADTIPEVVAWLGFPARRNPLFLPPRGAKLLSNIGLDGVDLERLRDAQQFALDDAGTPTTAVVHNCSRQQGSSDRAALGRTRASGVRGDFYRVTGAPGATRNKVSAMNSQLASAQESIRDLETSLRCLEDERDKGQARAARAREAAAEAGRQNMAQKMYRLRGRAACLEEDVEGLSGEIRAVRVRLFAEKQDVLRKRRLKDAVSLETAAKARARRRKVDGSKETFAAVSTKPREYDLPPAADSTHTGNTFGSRQREGNAVTIQAHIRGVRARAEVNALREQQRSRDRAAARIGAVARGRLARKRGAAAAKKLLLLPSDTSAVARARAVSLSATRPFGREETGLSQKNSTNTCRTTKTRAEKVEGDAGVMASREPSRHGLEIPGGEAAAGVAAVGPVAAATAVRVETLGAEAVRTFFDSLGLGACTGWLCRRPRSTSEDDGHDGKVEQGTDGTWKVDGIELARIMRAEDSDAELLAIGVNSRLHRIKIMMALGIKKDKDGRHAANRSSIAEPRIADTAILHMVRRLRREQLALSDTLKRLQRFVENIPAGHELGEVRSAWRGVDALAGGCEERRRVFTARTNFDVSIGSPAQSSSAHEYKHRITKEDGKVPMDVSRQDGGVEASDGQEMPSSAPALLLPELQEAVSAQEMISRQALELLDHYASSNHTPGTEEGDSLVPTRDTSSSVSIEHTS